MGVVVTFNYARWLARYPEFAGVTETTANEYFAEACIYHNNTPQGVVCDEAAQRSFLNMVTAFIAARYSAGCGPAPSNTPVGRLASASEGSVSASFENDFAPGSAQFWQQNKYGSDYWNATKAYRSARYRACVTPVVNGLYPGLPYGRGYGGPY